MRPPDITRELIQRVRRERAAGAPPSALVRNLFADGFYLPGIAVCFDEAFLLDARRPSLQQIREDEEGMPLDREVDRLFTPFLEEAEPRWREAPPYPDLLRRRDRHAFRSTAKAHDVVLVVETADPETAPYIGREGYRPCPVYLDGTARRGLLTADAARSEELARLRMRIAGDGVVRDEAGLAFYPAYRLLGAHSPRTGLNAWTGRNGERIRAELNRRMGEELVTRGPQPPGDPFRPVLFFLPDGSADLRKTADAAESYAKYLGLQEALAR